VPRDAVLSETPLCDLISIVPVTSLRYRVWSKRVYRAVPVRRPAARNFELSVIALPFGTLKSASISLKPPPSVRKPPAQEDAIDADAHDGRQWQP